MRAFALALALTLTLPALAEGPGSRLRSTPEVAMPPQPPSPQDETRRCNSLRDDLKARCVAETRAAAIERKPVGPESTGLGSGAGSSSTATGGSAASGGSAPR